MPRPSKPTHGQLGKLQKAFKNKSYNITVVNNIDKRMHTQFLRSKWNWYPKTSDKKWVRQFYIPDRRMKEFLGAKVIKSMSEEEYLELKALFMVRDSIWYRFQTFNKQFNNRWKIKYNEDTYFDIEVVDTSHFNHKAKDNLTKWHRSKGKYDNNNENKN